MTSHHDLRNAQGRRSPRRPFRQALVATLAVAMAMPAYPTTPLSDGPVFATVAVPGNVALALSVEWPTASRTAHTATYSSGTEFLGYFDPNKCYQYTHVASETATSVSHFFPNGAATNRQCTGSGQWSGNFLNWATMTTIDPFRWALTGGHRLVDTNDGLTILQRTWQSGQGLFDDRNVPSGEIAGATPFTWSGMRISINGRGFRMLFRSDTGTGGFGTPTVYTGSQTSTGTYSALLRVRVCDSTTSSAGPLESNCQRYPNGFYKPVGLIHEYSDRMRFAAFGYLNDSRISSGTPLRDGGVMRARLKFVGPSQPVPGATPVTNALTEWDPQTGIFVTNPDPDDAAGTASEFGTITNSGVMNYLNKFGQILTGNYKSYDPVGELYYATLRYFKNQGNVPEWSTPSGSSDAAERARWADAFPVITNWGEPMLTEGSPARPLACQRNFVLGIGDIYTHRDKNVPGATETSQEPPKPSLVASDSTVDSVARTNQVGVLQGLGSSYATTPIGSGGTSRAYMAGLAYDANIGDIRSDLVGRQSVSTYWVDVLEQPFVANNQFYLTAKYGGFTVPDSYTAGTALQDAWWTTSGETVGSQARPDNYFTAGRPDTMVSGLRSAFARIASQIEQFTTSFATALPQVATTGNASYSASYNARNWTGEMAASELSFDANDNPVLTEQWRFSERLATQLSGTGWDTGRRVATWNTETGGPVAFRYANLSTTQQSLVDPSYSATAGDGADLVNYLRGDRTHEQASTATGTERKFRTRPPLSNGAPSFLGDISGSKLLVVGPPSLRLSDATNPGYSTFRTTWASRPTMVYFGANDGFVRGVRGDLTGTAAGQEVFAYVPGALYAGPSSTPQTNGLVALANPNFRHYNFANATPAVFDIDFSRTLATVAAPSETSAPSAALQGGSPNWQSMLIGGLGSGGRSYYAINVTNPGGIASEADAVSRVMWEFSDSRLGFSFGEPVIVKTRQHGWVAVLPSGYNNADGQGYFLIVNPRNGQLIQAVGTGVGAPDNQAGLAHVTPFFVDRTDGTADAVYGADLRGNLWRLDLTTVDTGGRYAAPTRLAVLTDGAGNAQPVTSAPIIEIDPVTNRRYVVVGTGRALEQQDLYSSAAQSFYAIQDGTAAAFARTSPASSGTYPLTRADLVANTDPAAGVTIPANRYGWYIDLGTSTVNGVSVGWRVVNPPTSFAGTVAFASLLPSGGACEPSGQSRIYAINLANARSVLPGAQTGTYVAYSTAVRGLVTDLRYFSVNGQRRLIAGSDVNDRQRIREDVTATTILRRLNWREVPLTD